MGYLAGAQRRPVAGTGYSLLLPTDDLAKHPTLTEPEGADYSQLLGVPVRALLYRRQICDFFRAALLR